MERERGMSNQNSGPERTELFEALKNEMLAQGLSVQSPDDLRAFAERASAFIAADQVPVHFKGELLKTLQTQSQREDVIALAEHWFTALDEGQQVGQEAEHMATFAADVGDPEKIKAYLTKIEDFLKEQAGE